MKNDYRNNLKKLSIEGLNMRIRTLKQVIKDRAKYCTKREYKMLCYAESLLLNN